MEPTKRLARKNALTPDPPKVVNTIPAKTTSNTTFVDRSGLQLLSVSEKAFVVINYKAAHCDALAKLGGKLTWTKVAQQEGYMYANFRRPSVENYIKTGEITVQKYEGPTDTNRFQKPVDASMLKLMFQDFKDAFDADSEYDGQSIIDVIDQLEKKYVPAPIVEPAKKKPSASNNSDWKSKIPLVKRNNVEMSLDSESDDEK
jgi:hypothetical protein